ncbi:hypothetical protein ABZ934_24600 [Streptomyces sp. NPDC046557]
MSYEVIREPEALAQAERFAKGHPDGVREVFSDQQVRISVIRFGRLR